MAPLITLEEHYISSKVLNTATDPNYSKFPSHITSKLNSLGTERIQDLDNGHVSLQIISHGPGSQPANLCSAANDDLAAAIAQHPTRLKGFALLPMSTPHLAVLELERCVTQLGFVGALIDNHIDGQFYDDDNDGDGDGEKKNKFWPVFGKAEELNVPIYIHPSYAEDSQMQQHYRSSGYSDQVALALSAYGWGWHSDTALAFLRLFASGLFDQYPRLKIVLGHMGEMLPFQLDRTCAVFERRPHLERGLKEVWTQNVWITTSGMFSLAPLACLLASTGIERVLYSVDYPFSSNEKGYEFLERVRESGLIKGGEEWERFTYKNAEELLGVTAVHDV